MDNSTTFSGFPTTLNDQQEKSLGRLKQMMADDEKINSVKQELQIDDAMLLRVLRATMKDKQGARRFVPELALERLRKIMAFKSEHEVWMKPEDYDFYRKLYPRYCYKDYKLNKLIVITRFGEFSNNGKFSHLSEKNWSRNIGYEAEKTMKEMDKFAKERGVESTGQIAITDMKGLSWKLLRRKKAISYLTKVSGENFPEMLEKVYLINVPWIFSKVFAMLKPMLDEHTVSKFIVSSGIPTELTDVLDMTRLPKEFGGNSEVVAPYPMDSKRYNEDLIQKELILH